MSRFHFFGYISLDQHLFKGFHMLKEETNPRSPFLDCLITMINKDNIPKGFSLFPKLGGKRGLVRFA
jgi:hypothetical protein